MVLKFNVVRVEHLWKVTDYGGIDAVLVPVVGQEH